MKISGIDEAGKGCVLGSLVVCCATIEEEKQPDLAKLGVKDSKKLTSGQRNKLYKQLSEMPGFEFQFAIISPADIDAAVRSETTNLNWLEADRIANLINFTQPQLAVIDCPSPNIASYTAYVQKKLNCTTTLCCEHKADANHPIVSAASVMAKVKRDSLLRQLKNIHGDFGSGYPGDSKTRNFVVHNPDVDIIRKSWATYRNLTQKSVSNKV